MVKKTFITMGMIFLGLQLLSAVPSVSKKLPDLNAGSRTLLENGGTVTVSSAAGTDLLSAVPLGTTAYTYTAAAAEHSRDGKGFFVSSLRLLPYPSSWQYRTEAERQLLLFNLLQKVSTQQGITYISRRSGYKPRVLFTESYYIESPDTEKDALPDPVAETVPPTDSRYVYQDDSAFGGNTYQYTSTNTAGELFLNVTNCSPLKYHGITCLKENELSLCTSVVQTEDGVLLYSAAFVSNQKPKIKILFLTVDLESSFSRRVTSLQNWFYAELKNSAGHSDEKKE